MLSSAKKEMRREAINRARRVLNVDGNRLKLACAVLICTCVSIIMWLVSSLSTMVLDMIGGVEEYLYYPIASGLLYLLIIFLVAPLYVGCYKMALSMLAGENAQVVDIFDTFSSAKAYSRALRLSIGCFLRILPIIIAWRIHVTMDYLSYWFVFFDITVKMVNIFYIPVALLLVLFACGSFGSFGFAYMLEEQKLRKTRKYARKARKGNRTSAILIAYSTLLKLILSVFTLGIMTVLHVVPMAMLSYGAMAMSLKDKFDINNERTDI